MKKQTNQALVYMLGLIGIFLTFTIISQIATQYLAKSFNYSPSLGETLFYGFYNPFKWISWSYVYYSFYPDFFKNFYINVCGYCILFYRFYFGETRLFA